MTSSRVIIYLDNVIFHRLQCRLSDWNYADGDYDTWFSANFQYIIATKMLCLRGSAPDTVVGLTAPPRPSCETLGHTLAEGPTELRAPGPRDPTVRHCYARYAAFYVHHTKGLDPVMMKTLQYGAFVCHIPGIYNSTWTDMFIETTYMRLVHAWTDRSYTEGHRLPSDGEVGP